MLIEFSVENYRSIKDEAKLSLVAGSAKEHRATHVLSPEMSQGVRSIPLLRSAAIYGPNATGKSNLIRALHAMQKVVVQSGCLMDDLPITPFRFNMESTNQPTTFELVGVVNKMRFQYGFSATSSIVTDEWLYTWPKGRIQFWFERTTDSNSGEVKCKFGEKLAGDKEVWRRATRPNALFLSTAITLNSEQLQPIFHWFSKTLHVGGIGGWGIGYSAEWCESERKNEIVQFLQNADFAIDDLRITRKDIYLDTLPSDMPSKLKKQVKEEWLRDEVVELHMKHQTKHGQPVELSFDDESLGTQKIFEFAAPWIDTLDNGHVIVYDELHEHIHPSLLRFLVNQFHDRRRNKNGAQLVFSTHDTSILSQEIFRRDQIWFCERNSNQETIIFPLTDFHPRRGFENLERSYLGGRYGALPYLGLLQEDQDGDMDESSA